MRGFIKNWWNSLCYEPGSPRQLAGGRVKIAVIGGGTGLSVLLRGLKKYSDDISAIVAVTDDGSSSGILRKEFDILPPGDIRKCISALAYNEDLVSNLMEYRFVGKKSSLSGHSLGNIWITALSKYFGSFEKAIEATTEIFKTAGQVLPATLGDTQLCAKYTDDTTQIGESKIAQSGKRIDQVFLAKKGLKPYNKSVAAIEGADLIVIGPGSLFTSVIPNLLIPGIRRAISNNQKALKFYVANCSTERGETENFSVRDHIEEIQSHAKGIMIDYCLVNNKLLKESKKTSRLGEVNNITTDEKEILGCRIVTSDVVNEEKPLYHDSVKLAKSIIELYNKVRNK